MFHKEMTLEQNSGVLQKEKEILQELLATRSAVQAFQNNKTANILRKKYLSL